MLLLATSWYLQKFLSAWWKVYHTLTISKNIGELNYGKRIKDGNSNILLLQHTHLIYPYTTAKHWLLNKKVDKSRQKKMWYKALYTYITAQQSTYNKISSEWQVYRGDVSNFRWKEGGIELECIKPRIAKPLDSRLNTKHMTLLKDVLFFKNISVDFFWYNKARVSLQKNGNDMFNQ